MTEVKRLALDGVIEFTPRRVVDSRGDFTETYKKSVWAAAGVTDDFVQDNHSRSIRRFTLRGLHYQTPPFAQAKLVRVLRGRVLDVVVDTRKGSPTFARWSSVELSAETGNQLYVPVGFAHGFLTLEADAELHYKTTAEYSKDHERGIIWSDPTISLPWPLAGGRPILSEKDAQLPSLESLDTPFIY